MVVVRKMHASCYHRQEIVGYFKSAHTPAMPVKLAADASQYGLGAVIPHVFPDGEERPITFALRSLSKSENYSQIDKEALALIYRVRKFHTYLYGHKFTLVTDHKPLTSILGPKKVCLRLPLHSCNDGHYS